MAKNSVRDYSATNADNTDIQSIDISEGCSPAGINNAIREVMVDLKNVSTGAVALETPSADQLNVDNLRLDGNTISSTDTNGNVTIDPDGTGNTVISSGNVGVGTSSPNSHLTTQTTSTSTSAFDFGVQINNSFASNDSICALGFHNRADVNGTGIGGAIAYVGGGASGGSGNITFNIKDNTDISNVVDVADEKMRIDSSGNVGVGTTPVDSFGFGKAVDISSASGSFFYARDSDSVNGVGGIGYSGTDLYVSNKASGNIKFLCNTDATERMRITSSGALLVATTTAGGDGYTLEANGFLTHARASGGAQSMVGYKNGGNFVGEIRTSTTATAYITSSDYRLKENVTYDWDATTRLKQLKPARFNFIIDPDTVVDGFLAHEAQAVVPESVTGTHNDIDDDGNPVYQGIDQAKLVPLLVKTIQELEARITALEAE